MSSESLIYEIFEAKKHIHTLQLEHWWRYEFLTSQWWLLLALLIIPWIIWWRLVDKTKTAIILAYGIYIMFVVTALDAAGCAGQFWMYPIQLLPIVPDNIGIDWGLLTVSHMLIYQYFPRWKSFIVAEIIFAAVLAFIGEPIAEWLSLYRALNWYHPLSFPIYVLNAVVGKWLIEGLMYRQRAKA